MDSSVPDDAIDEDPGAASSFLNKARERAASSALDQTDVKIVYYRI